VGVAHVRGGGCQRCLNDGRLETVHCSTAVLLLLCGWRLGDVRRQGVELVYAGDVVPVARADDAPAPRVLVKARVLRRSLGHRWRSADYGDVRVDRAEAGGTRAGLEGSEGSLIMAFIAQVDWNQFPRACCCRLEHWRRSSSVEVRPIPLQGWGASGPRESGPKHRELASFERVKLVGVAGSAFMEPRAAGRGAQARETDFMPLQGCSVLCSAPPLSKLR
jgi:hypothetical protein